MPRLRTTHSATVYGERAVGEDAIGTEQTKSDVELAEIEGRYRAEGEGLTREERSERVDSSPTYVVQPTGRGPNGDRVSLMAALSPGNTVDIDGVDATLELLRVKPHYGRRKRPDRLTLELERIDG